jgi:hypothetical protein
MNPSIGRVRDGHGHLRIWRVTLTDGSFVDVEDTSGDSRESYARAAQVMHGGVASTAVRAQPATPVAVAGPQDD